MVIINQRIIPNEAWPGTFVIERTIEGLYGKFTDITGGFTSEEQAQELIDQRP